MEHPHIMTGKDGWRKGMKKKINTGMTLVALLGILTTMVLLTAVFYGVFRRQTVADLRIYALLLQEESPEEILSAGRNMRREKVRITILDAEGGVLYDNLTDSAEMENHSQRPEIRSAMESGEGHAVRRSSTLDKSTFYYAIRLNDGRLLRVAAEAESIYSILGSVLPSLAWIGAVLLLLSLLLAHRLTDSLLEPVRKLADHLGDGEEICFYEELAPFVRTIQKQHLDIVENARLRQEFTANVTHELKTPLTAISGYAELIETGMAEGEDVVRFAGGIHKSAQRLLRLINDILRLSELDDSQEEMKTERVNLYELAAVCVEMLKVSAGKHRVRLQMTGEECHVRGNRIMLEELLYNLCDNAIRYNVEGGMVQVDVYREQEQVILTVQDTGIGIPAEHQERIFERFYRVDKSRSKSTGGTGLGLAIVKHIVAGHQAVLRLESSPGNGTMMQVIFDRYRDSIP